MLSKDDFMPVVPGTEEQRQNLQGGNEKDNLVRDANHEQDEDLFDNIFLQPAKRREETKFSIRALQSSIKNHKAARYLMDFEDNAEYEGVTVCSVPKRQLEEKRRLLGAQHRYERELEEQNHAKFLKALEVAEEKSLSRVRIWHEATERYKDHFERIKRVKHRQYKRNLGNAFHAANKHFKKVIKRRKKKTNKLYGKLNELRMQRLSAWKHDVMWRNVPQKIKLTVKYIRGVKDKLPRGHYILLVTLRDRVGGKIVSIKSKSRKKNSEFSQGFYQQTMEVFHDGKYSSLELVFDQPLFLVSPSQVQRKPYMTISFELIQVSGPTPGLCCAWGSFPVEDSSFEIISGKFKVPLLRGWITNQIDQYWKYHQEYNKNLEKWMGNLYFHVKPMPREKNGKIETQPYVQHLKRVSDLVIQESRNLLSDTSDSENTETNNSSNSSSHEDSSSTHDSDSDEFSYSNHNSMEELDELRDIDEEDEPPSGRKKSSVDELRGFDEDEDDDYPSPSSVSRHTTSEDITTSIPLLKTSRSGHEGSSSNKMQPEVNSIHSEIELDAIDDTKPLIRKQRNPAELEKYKYNLPQPTGYKESLLTFRKGKYLTKAILNDMGISSWRSIFTREFWVTIFSLIISFFLRQYSHYFGQYVMLWLFNVPSIRYYPNVLYVDLVYQSLFLSLWQEIFVIVAGVGVNMLLFALLVVLIMLSQKAGVNVPSFASKLCVLFGLVTFMDPILILISDCIFQRWEVGDWFKLYVYYEGQVSGEGIWGIFVTLLLYIYLSLITGAIMYRFILRIFMNGRIIDVFARVHGDTRSFFVPLDLEVSRDELEYACLKARKYRGPGGVFRRLVVMEYSLTDPRDDAFFERSIHIIIYTLIPKPGGVFQRKVFRQFLQLENKAIVEIFDDSEAKSLFSNQMRSIDSSNIMNFAEDNNSERDEGTVYEDESTGSLLEDSQVDSDSDSDLIKDESYYSDYSQDELLSF